MAVITPAAAAARQAVISEAAAAAVSDASAAAASSEAAAAAASVGFFLMDGLDSTMDETEEGHGNSMLSFSMSFTSPPS